MKRSLLLLISLLLSVVPVSLEPSTVHAQTPGPDIGAFLPLEDEYNPSPWGFAQFQTNTQHHLDVFLWYQAIGEGLNTSALLPAAQNGSQIQLAWLPWDPGAPDLVNQPAYKLTNITNGNFDSDIHRWANDIKQFGYPVLFRPMGEMNGNWTSWSCGNAVADVPPVNGNSPADYVAAYHHVHDIFVADSVTNVEWVWAPNRDGAANGAQGTDVAQYTFDTYYPGDSYVDYIGIDGYNWGNEFSWSNWQDLSQIFGPSYDVFVHSTLNSSPKPKIMIAEMSSTEEGAPTGTSKASWMTAAYSSWLPYRFPEVENVTWFNQKKPEGTNGGLPIIDWRITSNISSQNAFNGAMQSLYDRSYFMNHYNTSGANSWVMVANPASVNSSNPIAPNLYIGGASKSSSPPAQINPNATPQIGFFSGLTAGPVQLTTHQLEPHDPITHNSTKAIMSQRILKGNSMEEVPSRDYANLSDHYYWPWYDNMGGFIDRIHISNLNPFPIFYEITLSSDGIRTVKDAGIIGANQKVDPQLPQNTQSGPLEVQTWVSELDGSGSQKKLAPAYCVPSQRVLYNNSTDFTEFHGVPAEELSDQYFWPWYDNASSGAADYVMIANPGGIANPGQTDINFTVKISGDTVASGNLPANQTTFRAIPATMGGPLEVIATDPYPGRPAPKVVVSQRTIWGPSFEEIGGVPNALLTDHSYWPWYDMSTAGVLDYVMIANPNANSAIYFELKWKGVSVKTGQLAPINSQANAYDFYSAPGYVDGPIEVQAWFDQIGGSSPASVLTSQRVIWKGFFDEAMGAGTN